MQTLTRLTCLALFLGTAAPSLAGSKGTHFLVEPYSGVMINQGFSAEEAVGLEAGGLVAIGGKLKGFPPRFYLYFKASHARFGAEDLNIIERGATGCVERSYTRLIGGLRVVVPLFWHLRMNLEFGGGSLFSENRYSESGRPIVSYKENLTVLEFGAGLNLRLFPWLSVGVMYDYTMVAEDEYGDFIATIVGEAAHGSQLGWSHLSATLGFHF